MGGKRMSPLFQEVYHQYLEIADAAGCYVDLLVRIKTHEDLIQLALLRTRTTDEEFKECLIRFAKCPRTPIEKFVNCAGCGMEISAMQIGGRILRRPYCVECLKPSKPATNSGYGPIFDDDPGPWAEKATREMEDFRE